ncbi:MAG: hypothetical protein AABW85_00050, partial [archaeon]
PCLKRRSPPLKGGWISSAHLKKNLPKSPPKTLQKKAFKQKGPVIIECQIDYSKNDCVPTKELSNFKCP